MQFELHIGVAHIAVEPGVAVDVPGGSGLQYEGAIHLLGCPETEGAQVHGPIETEGAAPIQQGAPHEQRHLAVVEPGLAKAAEGDRRTTEQRERVLPLPFPVASQGAGQAEIQGQSWPHRLGGIAQGGEFVFCWLQACLPEAQGAGQAPAQAAAPLGVEPIAFKQVGLVVAGHGSPVEVDRSHIGRAPWVVAPIGRIGVEAQVAVQLTAVGVHHGLQAQAAVVHPIPVGAEQLPLGLAVTRQSQGGPEAHDAAGARRQVVRTEGGKAGVGLEPEPVDGQIQHRREAEQIGPLQGLVHRRSGQGFAGSGVAVGAALDRPLQHELGLDVQLAGLADAQGGQVVAQVDAVAVALVGVQGQLQGLVADHGPIDSRQGHAVAEQDPRAPGLDAGDALVLEHGLHAVADGPRLGGRERVVGEGHLPGCPAVAADLNV